MHIRLTRSKRLYHCLLNLTSLRSVTIWVQTLRPSMSGQVRFYINYSILNIVNFNPIALSRLIVINLISLVIIARLIKTFNISITIEFAQK